MIDQNSGEEKTLTDYWNTLVRRWKVVVLVMALTFLGGVIYLRIPPPLSFPYKALIEVGGIDGALVESTAASIVRLKDFYIPLALLQHAKENAYEEERYTITVDSGEEEEEKVTGSLVLFGTVGVREDEKDLVSLLQRIIDSLLADHVQKVDVLRRSIAKERFAKEQEIVRVDEEITFLPTRIHRLDKKTALVKKQFAEVASAIQAMEKNRSIVLTSEARRGAPEQSLATTLLLIDSDLQKNKEKLSTFEEQLQIGLQAERDELEKAKKDLTRKKEDLGREIDDIKYRLEHLRETKLLIPPSRFLRKPPTAPRYIFQLTFFIGLFLGAFVAFFVEFAINARKQAKESQ